MSIKISAKDQRRRPLSGTRGLLSPVWWQCRLAAWASLLLLAGTSLGRAADPHATALDQKFLAQSPTPEAISLKAAELEAAMKEQARRATQGPSLSSTLAASHPSTWVGVGIVAALLALAHLVPMAIRRLRPQPITPWPPNGGKTGAAENQPFAKEFRTYLDQHKKSSGSRPRGSSLTEPDDAGTPRPGVAALEERLTSVPLLLSDLRALFSQLSRTADNPARLEILREMLALDKRVKELCLVPELRPAWQMSTALQGLLQQLISKVDDLTPSVLRSAAGAVDLLGALCVRGVNPNLATDPPIRILAVDDDAVSRAAVAAALQKSFREPDMAPDGQNALTLAALHKYDVILLDVEMPGMDGFELCTRLHKTDHNQSTPVVFVTSHNDFNSRAKSTLAGGQDLMAKPFLAFEVTVKTLTLVLRTRLESGAAAAPAAEGDHSAPAEAASARVDELSAAAEDVSISQDLRPPPASRQPETAAATRGPVSPEVAQAFFGRSAHHLQALRLQLTSAREATQAAARNELLGELIVGVHSLRSEADHANVGSASRLAGALEAMLRKLLECPAHCTPSTLQAAATAIETLEELCRAESDPDLAQPPVRLLVVDDDPVARRAMGGALQLAFDRPDTADSGETALTLAGDKAYDLIYLDVIMPGIDGFATCTALRESALNSETPIVFVTNDDTSDSRSDAKSTGGCGFIAKPVLASEITLTSLTFVLRGRLARKAGLQANPDCATLAGV